MLVWGKQPISKRWNRPFGKQLFPVCVVFVKIIYLDLKLPFTCVWEDCTTLNRRCKACKIPCHFFCGFFMCSQTASLAGTAGSCRTLQVLCVCTWIQALAGRRHGLVLCWTWSSWKKRNCLLGFCGTACKGGGSQESRAGFVVLDPLC